VAHLTEKTTFLFSPSLRFDHVLERCWLKENPVIHDHDLDCFYLGRDTQRTVFHGYSPRDRPDSESSRRRSDTASPRCTKKNSSTDSIGTSMYPTTAAPWGNFVHKTRHRFDGKKPYKLPPYRHSDTKKKAIREQVKEMLASSIIEASSSPYSSPIVMKPKKDSKF
jgi:hypothetical protein